MLPQHITHFLHDSKKHKPICISKRLLSCVRSHVEELDKFGEFKLKKCKEHIHTGEQTRKSVKDDDRMPVKKGQNVLKRSNG